MEPFKVFTFKDQSSTFEAYLDEYLKKKSPDCILYSEEGSQFKIHKEEQYTESNIIGFHFYIHRQNVLAKKSSIDFCTSKVPWVSSAANHDNKAGAVLVLFPFGTF